MPTSRRRMQVCNRRIPEPPPSKGSIPAHAVRCGTPAKLHHSQHEPHMPVVELQAVPSSLHTCTKPHVTAQATAHKPVRPHTPKKKDTLQLSRANWWRLAVGLEADNWEGPTNLGCLAFQHSPKSWEGAAPHFLFKKTQVHNHSCNVLRRPAQYTQSNPHPRGMGWWLGMHGSLWLCRRASLTQNYKEDITKVVTPCSRPGGVVIWLGTCFCRVLSWGTPITHYGTRERPREDERAAFHCHGMGGGFEGPREGQLANGW